MGFIPHRNQTGMGIEGMGIGTEFLTHGLPMLNPTKLSPNFICTYITGEQAVGCYSKGFTPEELEQPIGPFCTSSLGLVPKPNSDVLQMIQDMLFPHDHQSMCSINHSITLMISPQHGAPLMPPLPLFLPCLQAVLQPPSTFLLPIASPQFGQTNNRISA